MLRRIRQAQLLMDMACRKLGRPINIMEVCGSHTISIFRNAIRESIPRSMKILTGPGCSICILDPDYYQLLYNVAQRPETMIAARADLIKLPINASGEKITDTKDVTTVASVLDALELARVNPDKTVVYAGIGFETCVPGAAIALETAIREGIDNFCILTSFRIITAAMRNLLTEKNCEIDAFMCCGNTVAISGFSEYEKIMKQFNIPTLPMGFEPMQLIEGLAEICRQLMEDKPEANYEFAVGATYEGNKIAKAYIQKYFQLCDSFWRGLGKIKNSSYVLKEEYSNFDACKRFDLTEKSLEDTTGCRCGEIMCGLIEPDQCDMFNKKCSRNSPIGPCMASSEGACNIWARYNRKRKNHNNS